MYSLKTLNIAELILNVIDGIPKVNTRHPIYALLEHLLSLLRVVDVVVDLVLCQMLVDHQHLASHLLLHTLLIAVFLDPLLF